MKATSRVLIALAATVMVLTASDAKADPAYYAYGTVFGGNRPPPVYCIPPPPPPVVAYTAPSVVVRHPRRFWRHHPQWVYVPPPGMRVGRRWALNSARVFLPV